MAAYAVPGACGDASIMLISLHGVSGGGGTFFHVGPASGGAGDVLPCCAGIVGDGHEPVVGPCPDQTGPETGRCNRVNDTERLLRCQTLDHAAAGRGCRADPAPRQVAADRRPALSAIDAAKHALGSEVDRTRYAWRSAPGAERDRRRPRITERRVASKQTDVPRIARCNVVRLPRQPFEPEQCAIGAAAIDDVIVVRVWDDVAALAAADGLPVVRRDCPVVAPARDADGSAVLLCAVNAVRECVVCRDMVELRRGLVVPLAPRDAAVDRDRRALIDASDQSVRISRVDPQRVVIVAPGRSLDWGQRLSAIGGSIEADVRRVHDVGVPWIDDDFAEVPSPRGDPRVGSDELPGAAAVVRAIQPWLVRGDQRIHTTSAIAIADRKADASNSAGW